MAELPDPTASLSPQDRVVYDHMAAARSHAEGRTQLGDVYVRLFNNPEVASRVGALGEHLRFGGLLPDDARELAILRYASRQGLDYEISHHQRPARLAGLSAAIVEAVVAGAVPDQLPRVSRAVLAAVDDVAAGRSIAADTQATLVDTWGHAGVVELVALCGLYALIGYTVTAFDIGIEEGLPRP